jgi:iodothyronine deiodinase-like protein
VGAVEQIAADYGDRIHALMVYIREAHATDEWTTDDNTEAGIEVVQPTTLDERQRVAQQLNGVLALSIPVVVDDLDDTVGKAYGGWPERLYVIDAEGNIAYQGGYGPRDFKPDEVRAHLADEYGPPVAGTR